MVLTRRICLTITASPVGDHFPHSRDLMFDSGVIVWEGGGGWDEDASYPMILCVTESNQPKMCIPGFIRFFFSLIKLGMGMSRIQEIQGEEKKSGCLPLR